MLLDVVDGNDKVDVVLVIFCDDIVLLDVFDAETVATLVVLLDITDFDEELE
jgi:hypothetical protein